MGGFASWRLANAGVRPGTAKGTGVMHGGRGGWLARGMVVVAAVSLVGTAHAQGAKGDRYALLVGVRQYYATDLRELDYAEADVTDLASVFLEQGYRPENIVLMTLERGTRNVRRLPMAERIRHELKLLLRDRKPADTVVVALAGHGVRPQGGSASYYCPIDADLGDVNTLIPIDEIFKDLEACDAGFKLLMVDACRNDPMSKGSRGRPRVELASVTRPEVAKPPGGVVALFSCSAGEVAYEHAQLKHGVFFNFVIEGLRGGAARASDGRVTLPLLEDYVQENVERFVRDKFDVRQMPERLGRESGLTVLAVSASNRTPTPGRPTGAEAIRAVDAEAARRPQSSPPSRASLAITEADREAAKTVVKLLETKHLAHPSVDDKVARRWCLYFLKDMDPRCYYFEKADVDEFLARATTLDDAIRSGDLEFPRTVYERAVRRADERLATVLSLLGRPFDFTVDESVVVDPERLDWPADAQAAAETCRKRLKFELLQLKMEKADGDEAIRRLSIRYRDQNRFAHQFDGPDLLGVYLTSLARAIDPHSVYYNARVLEEQYQALRLTLEGIGAVLQIEDGFAVVRSVAPGGPADKDGRLQPGDKILAIRDDRGDETDLVGKKLSDVVRQLRGPSGTKARLVVEPTGTSERRIYELTRAKIELNESRAQSQIVEARSEDGKVRKIGVIKLPTFYGNDPATLKKDPGAISATRDCRRLLDGLVRGGADAVVLDLRGNSGGRMSEALTLPGLFLNRGPVVQVRDGAGVKPIDDPAAVAAYDGPLVVLIDRITAAAPEIVAGMIKDYGRGLVVGDANSFGDGTVQTMFELNNELHRADLPKLGAVKATVQQLYFPDGESIQLHGVTPHVHVPSLREVSEQGEAKWVNALKFDRVAAVPHVRYGRVPASLVTSLQTRSADRRQASPKFRELDERLHRFAERQARSARPLEEEKFRSDTEIDRDPAAAPAGRSSTGGQGGRPAARPAWEPGVGNDEILSVVADYLALGDKTLTSTPITLVNTDKVQTLHLRLAAVGPEIALAPGASRTEVVNLPATLMYYSIAGGTDPKVWVTIPISRSGAVRFRLTGTKWAPEAR